jgi:alkylmercury lyase
MDTSIVAPGPDSLVDALAAAFLDLSPEEQRLMVALYRTLLRGRPATIGELAAASGWPPDELGDRLRRWPGVLFDDAGRVVGFWGVATEETAHRVEMDGTVTWAWCALDPLFIVPLVGGGARVSSRCPVTGEAVSLTISPDAVAEVDPVGAVVSFLAPDRPFEADVRVTFCHYVLFFTSREAGERWTGDHPGTFLVSVEEAAEIGRRIARAVFPHASSPVSGAHPHGRGVSQVTSGTGGPE